MNVTPDNITELKPNEIFVYGSNTRGIHGAGAAKTALQWGAIYGRDGFAGQTYGISTKGYHIKTLPLDKIKTHVDEFTLFAFASPELHFLVTAIGTGLAGLAPEDIAPMFAEAAKLSNVSLPASFWAILEAADPIGDGLSPHA